MFSIQSTISLLIQAEKVNNSRNLKDEEKLLLLTELAASIPVGIPNCPDHLKIIPASIERMIRNERARVSATAKEQGRKAEGVQEQAEVAAGRTEEGSEASEGTTEGVEDSAEDDGRTRKVQSASARGKKAKAAN